MEKMNEDIKNAFDVLVAGGLILYPTDTIWGIGCDATNSEAVKKVFELKKRVDSKALIVLVDSSAKLDFYVEEVPDLAVDLMEMSEKPMTVIFDNARNVAQNLLAEDGSLAIRVTEEKFSHELCKRFRKALVSTSANVSGSKAPSSFSEIDEEIINGVDYVVKYRQDEQNSSNASSIIKLSNSGEIKIIRE